MPNDKRIKIGKVSKLPQKQAIASAMTHNTPKIKNQAFSSTPKIKKIIKEKPSPRQKKSNANSALQIVSGPLTPKKLIFNGILSNI